MEALGRVVAFTGGGAECGAGADGSGGEVRGCLSC